MENMFHKLSLTARTYHKILRVARTIADTQKAENIRVCDLTEAVCYRSIGDKFWEVWKNEYVCVLACKYRTDRT